VKFKEIQRNRPSLYFTRIHPSLPNSPELPSLTYSCKTAAVVTPLRDERDARCKGAEARLFRV
jgi:hypothetical protein